MAERHPYWQNIVIDRRMALDKLQVEGESVI